MLGYGVLTAESTATAIWRVSILIIGPGLDVDLRAKVLVVSLARL